MNPLTLPHYKIFFLNKKLFEDDRPLVLFFLSLLHEHHQNPKLEAGQRFCRSTTDEEGPHDWNSSSLNAYIYVQSLVGPTLMATGTAMVLVPAPSQLQDPLTSQPTEMT